jgi:hypothetical protein
LRRLAASLWRGPSPGDRRPSGEEEEEASSFAAGGGEVEEEKEKGQGPLFFCCSDLLELAPDAEAAKAEADAGEEPLSPLSALAAACSGAGRSAKILSPSTLLIISVIVDEVGHAKLVSVVVFDAAACWTCDAASWAERASAAPSVDQLPATVSAVSSRVRAAAFAARCREAWAVLRAASNSRA